MNSLEDIGQVDLRIRQNTNRIYQVSKVLKALQYLVMNRGKKPIAPATKSVVEDYAAEYLKIRRDLLKDLDLYSVYEKTTNYPVNLTFRKLKEQLKKKI